MSTINKSKGHFIPNFKTRSVRLVAAMAFGGIAGTQDQTPLTFP